MFTEIKKVNVFWALQDLKYFNIFNHYKIAFSTILCGVFYATAFSTERQLIREVLSAVVENDQNSFVNLRVQ